MNFINNKEHLSIIKNIDCSNFQKDLKKLYSLYKFITINNSYFHVILYNKLDEYMATINNEYNYFNDILQVKDYINKNLFHFLIYSDNKLIVKLKNWKMLDPTIIKEINIINYNKNDTHNINDLINNNINNDVIIYRSFLKYLNIGYKNSKFENINNNFFDINYLKNFSMSIDTIKQYTNFHGLRNNIKHTDNQIKLIEYIKYIEEQDCLELNNNIKNNTNNQYLTLGINLNLFNFESLYENLNSNLPDCINFNKSNNNTLKYISNNINEITIPQILIKVKDSWTSNYNQNLTFKSIHINHGPGNLIWFVVSGKDAKTFKERLILNENFAIENNEFYWFTLIEYCMQNKINFYYSVQKPGDILILKPNTIFWVKACKHCIITSWNILPKEYELFRLTIEKYKYNFSMNINNNFPLYSLILNILNNDLMLLDFNLLDLLFNELFEFYEIEKSIFTNLIQHISNKNQFSNIKTEYSKSIVYFTQCSFCFKEIINYCGQCLRCFNYLEKIFCVGCMSKHIVNNNYCYESENIIIYNKYRQAAFNTLQEKCENKLDGKPIDNDVIQDFNIEDIDLNKYITGNLSDNELNNSKDSFNNKTNSYLNEKINNLDNFDQNYKQDLFERKDFIYSTKTELLKCFKQSDENIFVPNKEVFNRMVNALISTTDVDKSVDNLFSLNEESYDNKDNIVLENIYSTNPSSYILGLNFSPVNQLKDSNNLTNSNNISMNNKSEYLNNLKEQTDKNFNNIFKSPELNYLNNSVNSIDKQENKADIFKYNNDNINNNSINNNKIYSNSVLSSNLNDLNTIEATKIIKKSKNIINSYVDRFKKHKILNELDLQYINNAMNDISLCLSNKEAINNTNIINYLENIKTTSFVNTEIKEIINKFLDHL